MTVVFGRMDLNEEIFAAIANNEAFAADLRSTYGRDLYDRLHMS